MTSTERTRWPDVEQPRDRRDALGDEQLVALEPAPGGRVGQLDVVGEAGIGGVVDRHLRHAGESARPLTLPPARREHRTHVRERVFRCSLLAELHLQGRCSAARRAGGRRVVRRPAAHRARRPRPGSTTLPGWLAGEQAVFDHLVDDAAVAPADGDDVGAPAARAAPDGVVDARRRGRSRCRSWRRCAACLSTRYAEAFDSIGFNCYRTRRRLGGVARRPPPPHDRRPGRRHRQRRRAATAAHPTARRRSRRARSTSAAATCS